MNKSQTISVIAITIFAAILLVGPLADEANAHCNKKHKEGSKDHDDKKEKKENSNGQEEEHSKNNRAEQGISQAQYSDQFSKCISGGVMTLSCNNVDLQAAATIGNNALGQQ